MGRLLPEGLVGLAIEEDSKSCALTLKSQRETTRLQSHAANIDPSSHFRNHLSSTNKELFKNTRRSIWGSGFGRDSMFNIAYLHDPMELDKSSIYSSDVV